MSEPLKPCPFCGSAPNVTTDDCVFCATVGCAIGPVHGQLPRWSPPEQWNQRAPAPSGVREIEGRPSAEAQLAAIRDMLPESMRFSSAPLVALVRDALAAPSAPEPLVFRTVDPAEFAAELEARLPELQEAIRQIEASKKISRATLNFEVTI